MQLEIALYFIQIATGDILHMSDKAHPYTNLYISLDNLGKLDIILTTEPTLKLNFWNRTVYSKLKKSRPTLILEERTLIYFQARYGRCRKS